MNEREIVPVKRECPGRLVPVGDRVKIPKNSIVTVVQSLGGTYTVVHNGNLIRVDGTDADALGFEPAFLSFSTPANGQIDEDQIWEALKTVYDPEIPIDLVNLGLIYSVEVHNELKEVKVIMSLTAPGCGMGPILVSDVEYRLMQVPNVKQVNVELVFDPPWGLHMMTEEAQLQTGMVF